MPCLLALCRIIRHSSAYSEAEVIFLRKGLKRTFMSWMYLDSYISLHGNESLRLENCRRILEYNDVLVRLQTPDMTVEVWGTGLRVFDYNDNSVLVTGKITSVHLSERRKRT